MSFNDRLASHSTLTRTQISALVIYQGVKAGQITLREAARMMPKPMKIGSYYRIVQQGKANLKSSVMAAVAGLYLGYLKRDDLVRLLDLASKAPQDMDEVTQTRLADILDQLAAVIVT